jgi:ADP-heptose:LPS heptosyltransferase
MFLTRGTKVADIQKIAVVRANALGDLIFALPALDALHAAYPQAEIFLLAQQWHAAFLKDRPVPVDRVVIIPPYGGVSREPGCSENPAELERFFTEMAQEHFDLALQLHGGGRYSNLFVRRLAASRTIGMKTPDAVALDRWIPYIYFQNEILRLLEVVSLIGASPTLLEPYLSVTQKDLAEADAVVNVSTRPLVVLHPGATDPRRRWPTKKFAVVGDALAAAGAQIAVTGTKQERHLVEAVIRAMSAKAQNLCDCLSLGGLVGILSRCRLVVSNDSGPLHYERLITPSGLAYRTPFRFRSALPPLHFLPASALMTISLPLFSHVFSLEQRKRQEAIS